MATVKAQLYGKRSINVVSVAGYCFQKDGGRYLEQLDRGRKAFGAFQPLSEKYDVKTVVQMHSGPDLHLWSTGFR